MSTYLSEAIANRFLTISKSVGEPIDPMKIQKLVYFAHGWHLGLEKRALSSEIVQAWQWGPVFPQLYHAVKGFGRGAITRLLHTYEAGNPYSLIEPIIPTEDDFANRLVRRIWDVYGEMPSPALSQLTHEPGEAWVRIQKKYTGIRNVDIPNAYIREDFERKIENARRSRSS